MAPPTDHKPITEAELREWEEEMEPWGMLSEGPDIEGVIRRLISEVRRLRAALAGYAAPSNWTGGCRQDVWDHPGPSYREAPGYQLARDALGWDPPDEPCDNPSCDGVKDDKTFGDVHRCFKDGYWLDDGSEM